MTTSAARAPNEREFHIGTHVSRAMAIELVAELLERGYTVDRADHESGLGFAACDGSGRSYLIRQGEIQVPACTGEKFRFRKIAGELTGQSPPKPRPTPPCFEQLELI